MVNLNTSTTAEKSKAEKEKELAYWVDKQVRSGEREVILESFANIQRLRRELNLW